MLTKRSELRKDDIIDPNLNLQFLKRARTREMTNIYMEHVPSGFLRMVKTGGSCSENTLSHARSHKVTFIGTIVVPTYSNLKMSSQKQ